MDFAAILLIAVGLAMDAFAVSLCKGMAMKRATFRSMLVAGLWFGGFQALMPVVGFYLGTSFYDLISAYDHWVAFLLLALIGANMIREGLFGVHKPCIAAFCNDTTSPKGTTLSPHYTASSTPTIPPACSPFYRRSGK